MKCPHRVIVEINLAHNGHLRKSRPCQELALSNGWCRHHQEGYEIMAIGDACGYPGLWINSCWEVGESYACWLAFACVARYERIGQIEAAIRAEMREAVIRCKVSLLSCSEDLSRSA